uniref:Uncharacterized protein n=2 Tax=Meloidogyne incognita TaxID=6306 RepID=A0A914LR20_MELIC
MRLEVAAKITLKRQQRLNSSQPEAAHFINSIDSVSNLTNTDLFMIGWQKDNIFPELVGELVVNKGVGRECDHVTRCHFDWPVYNAFGFSSEGCDDCQHNRMRKNWEQCKPNFYRDPQSHSRSICLQTMPMRSQWF